MGKGKASLVVIACLAFACGEGGTIIGQEGGVSDATGTHDIVFVPLVDGDGGDAAMQEDAGGGDGEAGTLARLGEPTFSPASGVALLQGETVAIVPPAGVPADGSIFYTLDGSAPTHQSPTYIGPVQVVVQWDGGCGPATATVAAVASAPGFADSSAAVADYDVSIPKSGILPAVAFSPGSESANNDFPLTLSDPGLTICYSVDGVTVPVCTATSTCMSPALTYTAPVSINGALVVNPATGSITVTAAQCFTASTYPVCAAVSGTAVSQTFLLVAAAPTMTQPGPGPVSWSPVGVAPTLATATVSSNEAASIHLTTDGTTPTCASGSGTVVPGSSTVGPFTSSTTVKAIACKTGYLPSSAVTFAYSIQLPPLFLASQNAAGTGLPGWDWAGTGKPATSMTIPGGATAPYGPFVVQQVGTVPCTGTAGAPEPSSCSGTAPPLADFICWTKTGAASCSCASPIALTPAKPTAALPASANVNAGDTLSVIACQSTPPVNTAAVYAPSLPTNVSF